MVTKKLADPENRIGQRLDSQASDRDLLDEIFLLALARRPNQKTSASMLAFIAANADKRAAWEDVVWTVLNSQEFIYQH